MNAPLNNAANLMLACVITLIPVIANASTLERVQTGQSLTLGFQCGGRPVLGAAGSGGVLANRWS